MNSNSDPPTKRGWLKIELHRAFAANGELQTARVYCPPRDKSMTLEECAACSHCTGCVVDSGSQEWQIRCERALDVKEAQAATETASEGLPEAIAQNAHRS